MPDDLEVRLPRVAIDVLSDEAYGWLSWELGKRLPKRRYAGDLAFIMACLHGACEHAASPTDIIVIEINSVWYARWIAFLRDCGHAARTLEREATERGWPVARPEDWPQAAVSFTL